MYPLRSWDRYLAHFSANCLKYSNVTVMDAITSEELRDCILKCSNKNNGYPEPTATKINAHTKRFDQVTANQHNIIYYQIKIIHMNSTWSVFRRFCEFDYLRKLVNLHIGSENKHLLPSFPKKTIIRASGKSQFTEIYHNTTINNIFLSQLFS